MTNEVLAALEERCRIAEHRANLAIAANHQLLRDVLVSDALLRAERGRCRRLTRIITELIGVDAGSLPETADPCTDLKRITLAGCEMDWITRYGRRWICAAAGPFAGRRRREGKHHDQRSDQAHQRGAPGPMAKTPGGHTRDTTERRPWGRQMAERWQLLLVPLEDLRAPGASADRRIAAALKRLLRAYGLVCLRIEAPPEEGK